MTDLNVALRLSLINQMRSGADAAKRDLESVRATAEKVSKARIDRAGAAAAMQGARRIEWAERRKAEAVVQSSAAWRRQRSEIMATSLAAERAARAAEVRAVRQARNARAAGVAGAGGAAAAATPGGFAAATVAGGLATQGRAAGVGFAKAFVGGLGIGIGVASLGQFAKESILGAATDEFERDQLRVLGNISEKQMEAYRKGLDRTARHRGIGSRGALGIFGGLMAGGLNAEEAASMTDNVAVFAKATQSSVEDASRTTIALRNNMGLRSKEEIMAAYDAINVGGKAGEFEVQDMARHLPAGLAKLNGLNEQGITGVRNGVAMLQAIRRGTGTSSEAMTQFEAMLSDFTSPSFIKNAGELGINIEKTMKSAEENGLSPVFAVLHEIEKKTKGDKFKLGKLLPNQQSRDAVRSILKEMGFVVDTIEEMGRASGSTMKDYDIATDNAKEAWNRFASTVIERSKEVAEKALPSITSAINAVTDALNGGTAEAGTFLGELQRLNADAADLLKGLRGESKDENLLSWLFGGDPGQKDILTPILDWLNKHAKAANDGLLGRTQERQRVIDGYQQYAASRSPEYAARRSADTDNQPLTALERRRLEEMRKLQEKLGQNVVARDDMRAAAEARRRANMNPTYKELTVPGGPERGRADDGTPMPYSPPNTFQKMLDGMRNPAGDAKKAMDEYNDALGRGLDDAKGKVSSAVAEMRALLNFTAGPTIAPNVAPAGGGASVTVNSNSTNNITTANPRLAARRAERERNRTVQMAMANALHDTGLA